MRNGTSFTPSSPLILRAYYYLISVLIRARGAFRTILEVVRDSTLHTKETGSTGKTRCPYPAPRRRATRGIGDRGGVGGTSAT